jgi:uncharacterized membrane protein
MGFYRDVRKKILNELLIIIILTVLLGVIVYYSPNSILRAVLGLPVLLFFPGYALLAALFPKRSALGSIEWMAFSLGVSIAVVSLIGVILNYTPWGITLRSALIANAVFVIAASLAAWWQRFRLADAERVHFRLNLELPFGKNRSIADNVISGVLTLAILGAIVTMVYAYAAPKEGEKFTEFYILGPGGKAADYTREMVAGQEGSIVIGIINREREAASYRVTVEIDGRENGKMGPIRLADGEKWEEQMNFVPDRVGDNQKLELYLYKNNSPQPYLKPLRLGIDVKSPG